MRLRLPTRGLRWHFDHNDGHLIDKWVHYFDVYERHFEPFRGAKPRILEIGVSHGGSLQMWRRYFGRGATIVGIDIEPRVVELAESGIAVHVGSQSDPDFLCGLVDRYGGFDIVIDDGSHWYADQIASLETLWPSLTDGGIYLVEDVHTSYMSAYQGGLNRVDTFVAEAKRRIDDLHAFWVDDGSLVVNEWTTSIGAIHIYDSIIVFDKVRRDRPVRRASGRPAFETLYGSPSDEMIDAEHRAQLAALGRPMARLRRSVRDPKGALERASRRMSG